MASPKRGKAFYMHERSDLPEAGQIFHAYKTARNYGSSISSREISPFFRA